MPITRLVIDRVESIVLKEGQPLITNGSLKFKWSTGRREKDDADFPNEQEPATRLHVDESNYGDMGTGDDRRT